MTSHAQLDQDLLAFRRYLEEQTWSPTTIAFYQYIVSRLVEWMAEQEILTFAQLEISQVKAFIAKAGWGNSMSRKLNSVLVQFLRFQYGEAAPLLRWRVKREVAPPQRTLDGDQAAKVFASFHPGISHGHSPRDRRFTMCDLAHPLGIRNFAILWTLIDTGFRSAEICNLELARLDLAHRTLTGRVKFGKWRTAVFSERTQAAIIDWLRVRSEFVTDKSDGRLFIGVMNGFAGMPLQTSGMRSMMRNLGRITGIGALSPHDFRRTFATLATRAGASAQAVKEAGGWSSVEMVMHYTRAIKGAEIVPHLPGNILQIPSPSQ